MNYSLKHTLILMLSIFTMLLSNYVSSAPTMAMNNMSAMMTMPSHEQAIEASSHHSSHHAIENRTSCHSMNDNFSIAGSAAKVSSNTETSHCDSGSGVDDCCASVCSSLSYPTDASYALSVFSSSLALHQSVKIGDKITRIQSLLRPPSA